VTSQPGNGPLSVAEALSVPGERLERLIERRDVTVDVDFLIDVIAALVHKAGVDPKWLLTGEYDPKLHRHALMIGEDRTHAGFQRMRDLVRDEFRRLRTEAPAWPIPSVLRTLIAPE
jgi:hypothetical protein